MKISGLNSSLLSLAFVASISVSGVALPSTNTAAPNDRAAHYSLKITQQNKLKQVCKWVEERIKNAAGKFEVRRTQVCVAVRG